MGKGKTKRDKGAWLVIGWRSITGIHKIKHWEVKERWKKEQDVYKIYHFYTSSTPSINTDIATYIAHAEENTTAIANYSWHWPRGCTLPLARKFGAFFPSFRLSTSQRDGCFSMTHRLCIASTIPITTYCAGNIHDKVQSCCILSSVHDSYKIIFYCSSLSNILFICLYKDWLF